MVGSIAIVLSIHSGSQADCPVEVGGWQDRHVVLSIHPGRQADCPVEVSGCQDA